MCTVNIFEAELMGCVFGRPEDCNQIVELGSDKIRKILKEFVTDLQQYPYVRAKRENFKEICDKYPDVFTFYPNGDSYTIKANWLSPKKTAVTSSLKRHLTKDSYEAALGNIINKNISKITNGFNKNGEEISLLYIT